MNPNYLLQNLSDNTVCLNFPLFIPKESLHSGIADKSFRIALEMVKATFDSIDRAAMRTFIITSLLNRHLIQPIEATLEPDDIGYIATAVSIPVHGYGDNCEEARLNLIFELESLFNELNEDDNFSDEWLAIKADLNRNLVLE